MRKDALLKAFHEIKHIAINENIGTRITRTLNIYLLRKYKQHLRIIERPSETRDRFRC